jgi:uncharacterized lipoprotein YmbA
MKVELTKVKVGFWCQHSIARIEVAENLCWAQPVDATLSNQLIHKCLP